MNKGKYQVISRKATVVMIICSLLSGTFLGQFWFDGRWEDIALGASLLLLGLGLFLKGKLRVDIAHLLFRIKNRWCFMPLFDRRDLRQHAFLIYLYWFVLDSSSLVLELRQHFRGKKEEENMEVMDSIRIGLLDSGRLVDRALKKCYNVDVKLSTEMEENE